MSAGLAVEEWPPRAEAASGERVAVLVHGVTGWHRTWWRVGPGLAERGWRVIAVDLRGHGTSPPFASPGTIDDMADDLGAVIEAHASLPIDLLAGHSLGAVVSMRLAHRRPSIARRVVLEDPPSIDRTADESFFAALRAGVHAARAAPRDEVERALVENPRWKLQDAEQDVEGRALADVEGIVASLRRPRGFSVVELAPQLGVPALYLLADERRSVLPPDARLELARRLPPGARVVEFDAGHTIHRDRFDEYLSVVVDWAEAT